MRPMCISASTKYTSRLRQVDRTAASHTGLHALCNNFARQIVPLVDLKGPPQ